MAMTNPFSMKLQKLTLASPDKKIEVAAMFNPKEISISRKVPWKPHDGPRTNLPTLEFTKVEPETLSLELFFDTYEERKNVYTDHIQTLMALAQIEDGKKGEEAHPPLVLVVWGNAFPKFKGVITSLAVKYTMFLPDGTPCRATATVSLQEAEYFYKKPKKKKKNGKK